MNLEDDESDDEVLNEIDVYLSKTLANNIYILQVNFNIFYFKKM